MTATAARRAAWSALGLLVVALSLTPITNNDIFLHLKTGTLILATGQVPRVDDYSALARGRPFVAHEWLAGVLFRLTQQAAGRFGFEGLVILKTALALTIAAILAAAARRSGARDAVTLPCLALVMILAAARIQERPHLFAYLLLALYLLVLARRRARRLAGQADRGLFALAPLQILWANLHGSFFLGPILVALAALAEGIEAVAPGPAGGAPATAAGERRREAARLAVAALLLAALNLVNPYGPALLRFPFALTSSAFMEQVYEWLPPYSPDYLKTYMARYYLAWAVIGAFACGRMLLRWRRRGLPPCGLFPIVAYGAFLALSLRMNRSVTDFALVTLPGIAALLSGPGAPAAARRREASASRTLAIVALLLLALALKFAVAGYWYSPSTARRPGIGLGAGIPETAVDYVEAHALSGACFNSYASGAYLTYRLYPRVRVGMDSRNDVYGEALYADYQRALGDPEALRAMLQRLDASFIFLEWAAQGTTATAQAIAALGDGWRPVYFDDVAVVSVREDGPYAALWSSDSYRVLDPTLFRPGVWTPEEAAVALGEADRALLVGPQPPPFIARVMRIEALAALGRRDAARADEARLVAEDPPLQHIHLLLGLAHLQRGERREAIARLTRAAALNPLSNPAAAALAEARRLPESPTPGATPQ